MGYLFLIPIIPVIILLILFFLTETKKGKGKSGELVASYLLNKLDSSRYFIINDITLKVGDRTTQIDHIVVSEYGIFVIETKNWKGKVYGSRWGKKVYQYLGGKKYTHQNPARQNSGHIWRLKEVLTDYPNLTYVSIVAFSGETGRKIKDDTTIKISELLDTISSYKDKVISKEDVEGVYNRLKEIEKNDRGNRREHRKNIRS